MDDGGRTSVPEAGEVDPVEVAVLDLPEPVGGGLVVRTAAEGTRQTGTGIGDEIGGFAVALASVLERQLGAFHGEHPAVVLGQGQPRIDEERTVLPGPHRAPAERVQLDPLVQRGGPTAPEPLAVAISGEMSPA